MERASSNWVWLRHLSHFADIYIWIFFVYPLMGAKYEVVGHVVGSRVKNVGDKITKSGLNGVKPSSLFNFLSVFIFVSVFAGITICLVNLRFVFRCQTS